MNKTNNKKKNEKNEESEDEDVDEEKNDEDDLKNENEGEELKIDEVKLNDDEFIDNNIEECIYDEVAEIPQKCIRIPDDERITLPKFTKYEYVKVKGIRANQIKNMAKVMLKNISGYTPIELAMLELKHKVCPLIIRRGMPNGKYEEWNVNDLELPELLD